MDNELHIRLRRLEVAAAGQREVLDGQAAPPIAGVTWSHTEASSDQSCRSNIWFHG